MAKAVKLCIIKQCRHKLPVEFIRWKPSGSLLLLLFFKIDIRNEKEKLERKEQTWSLAFPRDVWSLLPTSNWVQLQSEFQGFQISSRNVVYLIFAIQAAFCVYWKLLHCAGFIIIKTVATD